jgi:hypothetical protein
MSKNTVSTDLKALLSQDGSDEKDWKRLSKSKNEQGQWLRVFENKTTSQQVEVLEVEAGKFMIGRTVSASGLASEANKKFTKPKESGPIETSPSKNAAADAVIQMMFDDELSWREPLIEKAGKALANRFVFAVSKTDDTGEELFYARIVPVKYWQEQKDYYYEGQSPIRHLLPEAEDLAECGGPPEMWIFPEGGPSSATAMAEKLAKFGFIWSEGLQDNVDAGYAKELKMWATKSAAKKGAQTPKP